MYLSVQVEYQGSRINFIYYGEREIFRYKFRAMQMGGKCEAFMIQ